MKCVSSCHFWSGLLSFDGSDMDGVRFLIDLELVAPSGFLGISKYIPEK